MPRASTLSLLRERTFARLLATVEVAYLGPFIHIVACGWLMTILTQSATMVALIQTAYSLPLVVFSILAGALADTMDRRRTMIGSLAIACAASLALAFAAWAELLTPWTMLALLFVVGSGVAIFTPSWQASLGDIVPMHRLPEAVSLQNMGANLMRTLGPAVGGVLIGTTGAAVTFLVGAASYLPALVSLHQWRRPAHEARAEPERVGAAVGSGLRYLSAAPTLPPMLLRVLAFSICTISVIALLPVIVRDQLGNGAQAYGVLFGGYGFGAILGGLLLAEARYRFSVDAIVRTVALVNAAAVILLAYGGNFWFALTSTVLSGAAWLMTHSLLNSTIQLATPRWMVGRMVSMYISSVYLGLALGSWLWGALAERVGTREALAVSAAGLVGTFLLGLRLPLPKTAPEPSQLDPATEALIPSDLGGHDGPVQVMIEYRIEPAELPVFLKLMDERRRQIMRLGARRWALLRDAKDAERWTESFRTDGSGGYRRLMTRRSAENLSLRRRLWALHHGAETPVVRLMLETARDQTTPPPTLRA